MMRHQLGGLHESGGEAIRLFASRPIIYEAIRVRPGEPEMRLTMRRGVNALRQPVPATGSHPATLQAHQGARHWDRCTRSNADSALAC